MSLAILIVDDSEAERYLMSRCIEEAGIDYPIHEFEAGDHFLTAFQDTTCFQSLLGDNCHTAIILLDINMPRMTGFEVLEEMAKQPHALDHIVVLMITSSSSDEDRKIAEQYSFVKDFAEKPLEEDTIKSLINTHKP